MKLKKLKWLIHFCQKKKIGLRWSGNPLKINSHTSVRSRVRTRVMTSSLAISAFASGARISWRPFLSNIFFCTIFLSNLKDKKRYLAYIYNIFVFFNQIENILNKNKQLQRLRGTGPDPGIIQAEIQCDKTVQVVQL